jgi:hypothetical protein
MAERSLFAAALSPFFVVRLFLLRSVESRAWQPVWLSLPKFYRRECARDELLPETAVRLGVLLNPFSCSSNRFFSLLLIRIQPIPSVFFRCFSSVFCFLLLHGSISLFVRFGYFPMLSHEFFPGVFCGIYRRCRRKKKG